MSAQGNALRQQCDDSNVGAYCIRPGQHVFNVLRPVALQGRMQYAPTLSVYF
jgi:hypothetical protein